MPKTKEKESSKKGKDEVVINLDNAGTPIAILMSGIIIAVVIFFASRNMAPTTVENTEGATPPVADQGADEFSEGTVSLGDGAILGNRETATVAIVEYSDYQCGFCQRHSDETFPSIKANYIDTGKVLYAFKEFPLGSPGDLGYSIAEGGICVHSLSDSETFAEYHKGAFSLTSVDEIVALAEELGVSGSQVRTCLDEGRFSSEVEARKAEGSSAGIQGTPGFVVGLIGEDGTVQGTLIAGAYPYETFVETIEALLK